MATTKMKAPKSETCWGSNFDLRSLNILLLFPSISLSRNLLTLFFYYSCFRLLNSRTLHLWLLSSFLPEVFMSAKFLPSAGTPLHFFQHRFVSTQLGWLIFILSSQLKSCSKLPWNMHKYHWYYYHHSIILICIEIHSTFGTVPSKTCCSCSFFVANILVNDKNSALPLQTLPLMIVTSIPANWMYKYTILICRCIEIWDHPFKNPLFLFLTNILENEVKNVLKLQTLPVLNVIHNKANQIYNPDL